MNKPNIDPKQLLKRVLWLAFEVSTPMGMGFLHAGAANKQTEDSLFADEQGERGTIHTDYVFGRMMKTSFAIDGDSVKVSPETPRLDYQSWGRTYGTGTELVEAAKASLAAEPQVL